MRFDIITLFPEGIEPYCQLSILGRAFDEGTATVHFHQLRDFGLGSRKVVDDIPYGGGTGMILKPEPIFEAHESIPKLERTKTIAMTPRGQVINQSFIRDTLVEEADQLIIICGRYEGIDERVMELVDYQVSLGNYILTGGEIGALVIIDSVVRLLPGVLRKGQEVTMSDSFSDSGASLVESPQYTRPSSYKGMEVPLVLTNGNHQEIQQWREKNSLRAKTTET